MDKLDRENALYDKVKGTDIPYRKLPASNKIIETYKVDQYKELPIYFIVNHVNRLAYYQSQNSLDGFFESTSLSGIKRMIRNRDNF